MIKNGDVPESYLKKNQTERVKKKKQEKPADLLLLNFN